MLVAQKRKDESYLSQYEELQKQNTKVREVVVTKRGALRKFKAICAVVFVFGLCLFILFRYAQINEYNQKISTHKVEVSHLQKLNSQLQVALDKKVDLKAIEQLAVERLGMQQMDKSQIVYVQLSKKDYTEVPSEQSSTQKNGIFAVVAQGITELVGYLY